MHQLGPALDALDLRLDLGELIAFGRIELADDARDATDETRVDERIEANRDALLFELLFDLRLVDFFQALVVDDLDALPLLHVVDDHLADDAVGEPVILDPDRQVIEEVGRPQPLEVFANDLLDRLVVRHPLPGLGVAQPGLHLDVIQVGIRFDDRKASLLFEAGHDLVDHRPAAGGWDALGGRHGLAADGLAGLGRRRPAAGPAQPAPGQRRV